MPCNLQDEQQCAGALAAADSGDDMFADSDEEASAPASGNVGHKDAQERPAGEGQGDDAAISLDHAVASSESQGVQGRGASSGHEACGGDLAVSGEQFVNGLGAAHEGSVGSPEAEALAGAAQGRSEAGVAGVRVQAAGLVDYAAWPVSELKRMLHEAAVDVTGIVDKKGLVEAAEAVDMVQKVHEVPVGFVMDPSSGYFFNSESGLYFHAESGSFYKDGKWYSKDWATGELHELHGER
jgi:CD2 antigen cytoplasmic tail-binding protein 2